MKQEEILVQTDNVRVRVMSLLPGESTPWHFHRQVSDQMVCLTGLIHVLLRQPAAVHELQPGQRFTVAVGQVHQVANGSPADPATYLLIQGIGSYDFNEVESVSE
jgi:quercetin dioxygenase-like cupin family protein